MTDWRQRLREQGWVHLKGVVDSSRIAAANALIDADLEAHYDPARQAEYDGLSACPGVRENAAIQALYTALTPQVNQVLDASKLRCDPGQIAIRWANNGAPGKVDPHIDGVRTADNGVRSPVLATFTALLGVFLTPCRGPWSGNFSVWPGSTEALAAYFAKQGRRALLAGMPPLPTTAPLQLEVEPGDAVLCNYLLMHGCSPNSRDQQRRAVFFRLRRRGLALHAYQSLVNPWRDWRL